MTPKIALIGLGGWGVNHLRTWNELGALALVCDQDPARLDGIASEYPGLRTTTLPSDVFADPSIAGVVLATPADTHVPLALEAMHCGKDVLVEKPLALDVEEGRRLVDTAAALKRVAMVGHVLEFHPAVQQLSTMLASGELGQLRYLYSNRLNFGKFRLNEDTLWSFAPHDIALILRLAGGPPTTVAARGGAYVSRNIADSTMMTLGFPSGVEAHIFVSWLHPFKEQRLVVVGSAAMAVLDDTRPWGEKLAIYDHEISWDDGRAPQPAKAEPRFVEVQERMPLTEECKAFLQAIRTRKLAVADAASGLVVLEVLAAGTRSMASGGAPQVFVDDAPIAGHGIDYFAHPSAFVDPGASIGEGSKIWHNVHVMSGARIGARSVLGQNVYVGSDAVVGNDCRVQNNVSIYDGVELGDGVFCGPSMVFTNVVNPRAEIERKDEYARTRVGRSASIGANATIVAGNDIGEYAFVGAGAVVTSDVAPHSMVVGVPARPVGWVSHSGRVLNFDSGGVAVCRESGFAYSVDEHGLQFRTLSDRQDDRQ